MIADGNLQLLVGTAQYSVNGRHHTPRYKISMRTNPKTTYPATILTAKFCFKLIVKRAYMINRHALINHTVTICICSTTSTNFEPYVRSAISASVRSGGLLGSIRLVFVTARIFMHVISTVSVTCFPVLVLSYSTQIMATVRGVHTIATSMRISSVWIFLKDPCKILLDNLQQKKPVSIFRSNRLSAGVGRSRTIHVRSSKNNDPRNRIPLQTSESANPVPSRENVRLLVLHMLSRHQTNTEPDSLDVQSC